MTRREASAAWVSEGQTQIFCRQNLDNMAWIYYNRQVRQGARTAVEHVWKRIEVVVTSRTRNAVVREGTWVRIPPLPPNKNRNVDTMGIRIAALFFFAVFNIAWQNNSPPPSSFRACRMAAGYRFIRSQATGIYLSRYASTVSIHCL